MMLVKYFEGINILHIFHKSRNCLFICTYCLKAYYALVELSAQKQASSLMFSGVACKF